VDTVAARRGRNARIGVISDTHGYLDPEVLDVFAGVDHIVHAGDLGNLAILEELESVAPVTAVCGNIDTGDVGKELPREVAVELGGMRTVVGHKRKRVLKHIGSGRLFVGEDGRGPDLVIVGHDHQPSAVWVDGTLLLNPGTASAPYEEDDDPTVAIVEKSGDRLETTFIPLRRRKPEGQPGSEG
jgi:putative phosphoesterase